MTDLALVDNDVVLKLCRYGYHRYLKATLGGWSAAILNVSRFALRDRVRKTTDVADREQLAAAMEEAIETYQLIQPDNGEVALAADLEEEATRRGLELDAGESQLLAVLLTRTSPVLLTGDKRAVVAIHGLGAIDAAGRVGCLEQIMGSLLTMTDFTAFRRGICADPGADRAITASFACSTSSVDEHDVRVGLRSYINHLRAASGGILLSGDQLPDCQTASAEDGAQR